MHSLPRASVSSCGEKSDPENWTEISTDVSVNIDLYHKSELSIFFETDAPKRNTRYCVTLTKDDLVDLLENIAEDVPGMTETFVKCLSRIIEKNTEYIGRIADKLTSLEVGGYQKTAIEALLRDVKPEKP